MKTTLIISCIVLVILFTLLLLGAKALAEKENKLYDKERQDKKI